MGENIWQEISEFQRSGKIKFTKSFRFHKFCVQGSIRASRLTSPLPGSSPSLLSRSAIIIVSNITFQISHFKYQISNITYHISNITFQIARCALWSLQLSLFQISRCAISFLFHCFVISLFRCSFVGYCSNNE